MLRPLLFLTLFLFALAPHTAQAAQFNGSYLLKVCETKNNGDEMFKGGHATCQSYISGVIDYHNMLQSMNLAPELRICIPDKATPNNLHLAVLHYLRANKQHDAFVAAPAVIIAIHEKYPCKD